jgi:hypothetical protein
MSDPRQLKFAEIASKGFGHGLLNKLKLVQKWRIRVGEFTAEMCTRL